MKSVLALICLFLSIPVFATKARMSAMTNSPHIIDEQILFSNPLALNYLESFISFESGDTNASATATGFSNAEVLAGIKKENKFYVLALGHQDPLVLSSRKLANSLTGNFEVSHNNLHLFYGAKDDDFNYSLGFYFSSLKNKVATQNESSTGLQAGVELGPWQLFGAYNFVNVAENPVDLFDAKGAFSAQINYLGEYAQAFLSITNFGVKTKSAGASIEDHDYQKIVLGLVESTVKEENDIFWGVQLESIRVDCHRRGGFLCEKAYERNVLPVWLGFEAQATSLIVLRASLTQTVLGNQTKDDVGYPAGSLPAATGMVTSLSNGENTTSMAAGIGLKYKNIRVEGSLQAANTQNLNQNNLLSQISVKYNF